MKISKLAKDTGHTIQCIHYYEKIGLIPKAKRLESGYREYDNNFVERLNFIKNAKQTGFTLKEISELQDLKYNRESICREVKIKAESKINEIDKKIEELHKIKDSLKKLVSSCKYDEEKLDICPIIQNFESKEI